ncbi:MAG: MBL fold metallo-hydrolase [Alphaproteobacteria bacterium]
MSKPFASTADTVMPKMEMVQLTHNVYAVISGIDPTNGLIVGDTACLVVDTRATPKLARELIAAIRTVTDKPIRYIALTHYHAVRTMGYGAFGKDTHVIASTGTRDFIMERGAADFESEVRRFPRLFNGVEEIKGLTYPDITFPDRMSLWCGNTEVQLINAGKAHTAGDTLIWLPRERIMWGGDIIENNTIPYMGDSFPGDWPRALEISRALRPQIVVPGRGGLIKDPKRFDDAVAETNDYISTIVTAANSAVASGKTLKETAAEMRQALKHFGNWPLFEHCFPFNVVRAVDFAQGIPYPRIWTAERDAAMWNELQAN